jgi:hypothetical protein
LPARAWRHFTSLARRCLAETSLARRGLPGLATVDHGGDTR